MYKFLTDVEVAATLGVSLASVRRWRLLGTGPRYVKIGGSVRYNADDLLAFVQTLPTGGGVREVR